MFRGSEVLLHFKLGYFEFAVERQARVVPTLMVNTAQAWSPGGAAMGRAEATAAATANEVALQQQQYLQQQCNNVTTQSSSTNRSTSLYVQAVSARRKGILQ